MRRARKVSLSKDISTLVEDIYGLFNSDYIPTGDALVQFSKGLSEAISRRVGEEKWSGDLRLSTASRPCLRQLWYGKHSPEDGEILSGNTRFKFLYGDLLEELVLFLAKEAGHKVEGRQDEVEVAGVKGHRDAIIDGMLVDIKSASSLSFDRFLNHLRPADDKFGYIGQLGAYLEGSQSDERLLVRDRAAFVVVDKTLGHICLDIHEFPELNYAKQIEKTKSVLAQDRPPPRPYPDVPDGKSGNRKLGVECSYCPFKHTCWPNLRTFYYANGPRYLTQVERTPDVNEA